MDLFKLGIGPSQVFNAGIIDSKEFFQQFHKPRHMRNRPRNQQLPWSNIGNK